jgi:antitoxin YefM
MDKVCDDREPIIVTRNGHQPVVLMSLEDYESLEETAFLLRSPNNARRIFEAIEQIERGEGVERDLIE